MKIEDIVGIEFSLNVGQEEDEKFLTLILDNGEKIDISKDPKQTTLLKFRNWDYKFKNQKIRNKLLEYFSKKDKDFINYK